MCPISDGSFVVDRTTKEGTSMTHDDGDKCKVHRRKRCSTGGQTGMSMVLMTIKQRKPLYAYGDRPNTT